ncbi:bifunctional ADP-dependent NAD(P)H-hydrate dehydratase/NAD(P)H-hydrate epimerase [Cognatishimia maritima]|uniref:Bifunctional NAD(P)H-hydrate repair enzyme n=1 Tax=Cognatishimia maritima TaxID=870908 RepID=A0A1M5JKM9_9RHOB|nr:bifunctional ADP-dependent NAD(P)H-hydrate dehydratase/NAD(P)H-hydrate epimerase [Cognatishimia maritima]SHG41134.1 yjeF C-terminal region, hydroxyethylthiazole kinase-related/yjeF N-terminal region [Cognatishimia maritima]
MTELLTAAQMRAIEQAAIESGETTGVELMERAGQGVVDAIFEEWPELAEGDQERGAAPRPAASPRSISAKMKRAVVLCGPGNNGGDGFVVARLLFQRGWAVEVFLYGNAEKLPSDARVNFERWLELGEVRALEARSLDGYAEDNPNTKIAIDALFGTGLSRPFHSLAGVQMELNYWEACSGREGHGISFPYVVAIDVVSGICSDSGKYLGVDDNPYDYCAMANLTVSFHERKLCHVLHHGPRGSGQISVCDLGLKRFVRVPNLQPNDRVFSSDPSFYSLSKFGDQNKFGSGHALILSGGPVQTGAARLSARGALRIGAGLVTLGVPLAAQQEVAAQVTAIMLKPIETPDDLTAVLQDSRINALCLGPALGLNRARRLVAAALDAGLEARPTVFDADALSAFADEPSALFEMLHENCVLTPHGGEFARLFPDIAEKLNAVPTKGPAYSKVDATRKAAKRAGCVVLFKGAATVIAAPDGRCSINSAHYERSAPWLATAGSGDVLAGFITGLLARGFSPMQAAETAAWLHVECALKFGPGLIAEDIPEQLPAVFKDLGV